MFIVNLSPNFNLTMMGWLTRQSRGTKSLDTSALQYYFTVLSISNIVKRILTDFFSHALVLKSVWVIYFHPLNTRYCVSDRYYRCTGEIVVVDVAYFLQNERLKEKPLSNNPLNSVLCTHFHQGWHYNVCIPSACTKKMFFLLNILRTQETPDGELETTTTTHTYRW